MLFIFSGSGGGWNTTLSLSTDFSQIWNSFKEIANRTQPTGFSSDNRYRIYDRFSRVPIIYFIYINFYSTVGLEECHVALSPHNMEDLEVVEQVVMVEGVAVDSLEELVGPMKRLVVKVYSNN